MGKITAEDIALLSKEAPGFIHSTERVKQAQADFMVMSIHGFASEKETILLKTCLQYAREQGVTLVFVPGRVAN